MTIFGFNTDIRYGDTVYHVQTEPYPNDLSIQTAIFVRGRCLDKCKVSYAEEAEQPGFSDDRIHELLTRQHKFVLTCIREGKLGSVFHMGTLAAALSGERKHSSAGGAELPAEDSDTSTEETDILGLESPEQEPVLVEPVPQSPSQTPPELRLSCLASPASEVGSVITRYRLTHGSAPVEGAKLVGRFEVAGAPAGYSRATTNADGDAALSFTLPGGTRDVDQLTVTIQASHSGQSVARRFRISRN